MTWIAQLEVEKDLAGDTTTIAAYVPVGSEPGSIAMLEALRENGHRVLLPVVSPGPPAPLNWSDYHGPDSLTIGRFGLLEPTGDTLPSEVITTAHLILVPALAVDRSGVRLGRGAGYYDRTIASVETKRLVAVVYDDEVLDTIPADDLDVPMGWSLTPAAGFAALEQPDPGTR